MRPLVYSLLVLGMLAVGWFSAQAKPPTPAAVTSEPDPFADHPNAFDTTPATLPPRRAATSPDVFDFSAPSDRRMAPRDQYLKLAQELSGLLTEEELRAETAELERKLAVKRSQLGLDEVRRRLQLIVEQYPSTPAAERAAQLLRQFDAEPSESAPAEDSGEAAEPTDQTTPSAEFLRDDAQSFPVPAGSQEK